MKKMGGFEVRQIKSNHLGGMELEFCSKVTR